MNKSKPHNQVQFAALPFCIAEDSQRRVMLLTSRETRRWVIPKGWPMPGRKPCEVAAQEAFEEAGLLGTIVGKHPVGRYHYSKQLSPTHSILCEVSVFLLRVDRQLDDWPEKNQRWFDPSEACELVDEGGLAEILRLMMCVEALARR
jgi:8-oxo-dGTP pyrophosphatase MutT (NUDIX family)